MKYVIFLGDGMADVAVPELGGKTPLEAASHPTMDELARRGLFGMVQYVGHQNQRKIALGDGLPGACF